MPLSVLEPFMRILVVSDTHGNLKLFQSVVDFATKEQNISAIWHLGDNYDDCDTVNLNGKYVVRVPGIWHPGYNDGTLDSSLVIPYDPFNFLLLHDPADAKGMILVDSNVILHGHTHKFRCEVDYSGRLFINPGHLKARRDRGYDASFVILTIESGLLIVDQYLTNFEHILDNRYRVSEGKVQEL